MFFQSSQSQESKSEFRALISEISSLESLFFIFECVFYLYGHIFVLFDERFKYNSNVSEKFINLKVYKLKLVLYLIISIKNLQTLSPGSNESNSSKSLGKERPHLLMSPFLD